MTQFKQISIIGVGLIGGSLAKAIKKEHLANKVVGFFRSREKLNKALKYKIVDAGFLDIETTIKDSDLIILASPVNQILNELGIIKDKNVLVIDVGSSKSLIVKKAAKLGLNFIGTHPMAGSEKKGMDFSSNELFKSAKVFITPIKSTNKAAVSKVINFWKKLNTKIIILTPEQHDKIISFTSHLPHLVSFSLIKAIPMQYLPTGASGLKDTTRIALSDAEIWADIFLSNKEELLNSLEVFEKELNSIKKIIFQEKREKLIKSLTQSKTKRERIN